MSSIKLCQPARAAGVVRQIVDELADYTKHHFAREESLIGKTEYPKLESHRNDHQEFLKKLKIHQELAEASLYPQYPSRIFSMRANFTSEWFERNLSPVLSDSWDD